MVGGGGVALYVHDAYKVTRRASSDTEDPDKPGILEYLTPIPLSSVLSIDLRLFLFTKMISLVDCASTAASTAIK